MNLWNFRKKCKFPCQKNTTHQILEILGQTYERWKVTLNKQTKLILRNESEILEEIKERKEKIFKKVTFFFYIPWMACILSLLLSITWHHGL